MRILFVHRFAKVCYLADQLYHGLMNTDGLEVTTLAVPWILLKNSVMLARNHHKLQGKGIGYGVMVHPPIIVEDDNNVRAKIVSKYYDKIIFGNVRRCMHYFDQVRAVYGPKDIALIDSGDNNYYRLDGRIFRLAEYGMLFKRELDRSGKNIFPISFSIKHELLAKKVLPKTQLFATTIPDDLKTYKWNYLTQRGYFDDYSRSYYGVTCKKGGWDCLRHYEILASRCIPSFPFLEDCPPETMTTFPKTQILACNKYSLRHLVQSDYDSMCQELFEYTSTRLTTKATAKYVLDKLA